VQSENIRGSHVGKGQVPGLLSVKILIKVNRISSSRGSFGGAGARALGRRKGGSGGGLFPVPDPDPATSD
jgi:hypothetical protein